MRVKLLVNLKTANGSIISAGTIFNEPIPEVIMKRVARRQAVIMPDSVASAPVTPAPAKPTPVAPVIPDVPKPAGPIVDEADELDNKADELDNKATDNAPATENAEEKDSIISSFSKKILSKKKKTKK